jgi:hypothetical protein
MAAPRVTAPLLVAAVAIALLAATVAPVAVSAETSSSSSKSGSTHPVSGPPAFRYEHKLKKIVGCAWSLMDKESTDSVDVSDLDKLLGVLLTKDYERDAVTSAFVMYMCDLDENGKLTWDEAVAADSCMNSYQYLRELNARAGCHVRL